MSVVTLPEWMTIGPQDARLKGKSFEGHPDARRIAEELTRSGALEVRELREGLYLRTTSFVGHLRLGEIELSIRPKIEGRTLFHLLRYACGLRNLSLYSRADVPMDTVPFQDLLLRQLADEVRELLFRGLRREYHRRAELLASPRGGIDFGRITRDGGVLEAALPCVHHVRTTNCLHNQVVLEGLKLGSRLTEDPELRGELRMRARELEVEGVKPVRLDHGLLEMTRLKSNRLTQAYEPALGIIDILLEGQGIPLEPSGKTLELPGFLFDMNLFLQRLMLRFLSESLPDCRVDDEPGLATLMRYTCNPRRWWSPRLRPDFIVTGRGGLSVLLDAKYRDIWNLKPTRDMLYQLAIYALSQGDGSTATILYPTMEAGAEEARLEVREPLRGLRIHVALRPVYLPKLEGLLAVRGPGDSQARRRYAFELAFGPLQTGNPMNRFEDRKNR